MRHTRAPRIGVVGMGHFVYWPQFPGLKERLLKKQEAFKSYFSPESTVVDLGFADDADTAFLTLKKALGADLDALFLVMTTYVTSAVLFPFARYLPIPQILVGLQPLEQLDYGRCTTFMQLENDDVCSMPEFAGVYERLGAAPPFFLAETAGNREEIQRRVGAFERAIAAVAAFKYAKFGYLGHTYDGMYDMNTDPTAFSAAFGSHVKMLEMCELREFVEGASEPDVREKAREIREIFDVRAPSVDPITDFVTDEDLFWAARCSHGLDRLVEENGLSSLAYYYKGENGNLYERIASSLVVGNTLLTSRGIPLAGEADLKTAAAMLAMNKLAGGASFAELHPFDVKENVILVGHDGPHDVRISDAKPILRKLKKFHGKPGAGVSVEFRLKTGPVTLLSLGVGRGGRFRFVAAAGESVPGEIPQTGNTNTKCRFSLSPGQFVERWSAAGPTHHLALGTGNRLEEIGLFARMMGIDLALPLA